jgi:hypothetical protein
VRCSPHLFTLPSACYLEDVIFDYKSRRRWFGALCLLAAVGMLVAGDTVLKDRLSAVGLVLFWLGCFGFVVLAIFTALVDARAARLQGRREQRRLFEEALAKIEREKKHGE